jgi:hypothetical protein
MTHTTSAPPGADLVHDAVLYTASGDFRIDRIDAWRQAPAGAGHTTELFISGVWVPVRTDDGHEAVTTYLAATLEARQDAGRARAGARLAATLGADGVADLLRHVLFELDHDHVAAVSTALSRGLERAGTWGLHAWIQAACRAGAGWPDLLGGAFRDTLDEAEDPHTCPACQAQTSEVEEDDPVLEVYSLAEDQWQGECANFLDLCTCRHCHATFLFTGDVH